MTIPTHSYPGCDVTTAITKYASTMMSLSDNLNDANRTLSEKEFAEIVSAIGTIKTEETRNKMSSILFRHIASISGYRSSSYLS